jgi:hypothetical protein
LSGIPFGGAKAFIDIVVGIPCGGKCLLVYGPHVNVDDQDLERTFCEQVALSEHGGCSGAINAAAYAKDKSNGVDSSIPSSLPDKQQFFLNQMLLAYSPRLQVASKTSIDLPIILFDVQTALINHIVAKGCRHIQNDQLIVIVGGVQFNTPHGKPDYFLPLRFDVVDRHGKIAKIYDFTKN